MKKIILSLLLVVTTCSFAQSSFKGTLFSPDQKPRRAANVILMSLPRKRGNKQSARCF